MPVIKPTIIQPGYEPVDGYVLEEMLGRGGFGEVWRAVAPGGLKKAIKFVFGDRDERRAEQELKSLERIKGVQHPFILTLERFEIVDGRLVIVTELADRSLEDIVKDRRAQGSCGIARPTLLSYLRDTADALDYLHQLYKLQHLDIKPANLLLVGGRVKVADFGLLKDLRDIDQSVVGGLTPIYAPPELFDGRPSLHSDQYSLAVMYQELLTGKRPFSGRTIAQLATQHIHNAPNLTPLPPSDRPIIARALEKNPQRRYQSCTAFVDALLANDGTAKTTHAVAAAIDPLETQIAKVEDLPQLGATAKSQQARNAGHALLIGLGGTGADCVVGLRRRIDDFRSRSPMVLHSVVIDLDATAGRVGDDRQSECLPTFIRVNTPLRSAMEYRNRGTNHLKSISRRWIYNVPRSGATEGMRPLGRLALIDHADQVKQAISDAIQRVVAGAGDQTPNVYLVGSLAGGAGSGMFIDVAHLVRNLLDDAGLHHAEILSLTTTGRLQGDASRPLVLHDTKAALNEVRHFLMPGNSYPGDEGVQWPGLPAARTPLRNMYLIATPQSSQHPTPVQTIIEYVWADVTNVGELLESARQFDDDQQNTAASKPSLRSVGIIPLSGTRRLEENVLAPSATRHLLRRWLGDPLNAKRLAPTVVERVVRRSNLAADTVLAAAINRFGADAEQRRADLIDHLRTMPTAVTDDQELLAAAAAQCLSDRAAHHDDDAEIQDVLTALRRELAIRLQAQSIDMATAIRVTQMLSRRAKHVAEHLLQRSKKFNDQRDISLQGPIDSVRQWADQRIEQAAATEAAATMEQLSERLANSEQLLSDRAMLIAQAIQLASENETGGSNAWHEMHASIREQFEPVMKDLHGQCAPNWLVKLVTDNTISFRPAQIVANISKTALPLVSRAIAFIDGDDSQPLPANSAPDTAGLSHPVGSRTHESLESMVTVTLSQITAEYDSSAANSAPVLTIEEAVAAVRPAILACGGYQRLILVVGSKAEQEVLEPQVQQYHSGSMTTVVIDSAAPMLIHEAQRINIDDVIKRLTTLSGGESEIGRRLMSRTDISWNE